MTQPVIDTLKLADSLKESGFPDRQAEGLARALGRALTEHVVTKADLDAAVRLVRADLDAAIRLVRADIVALDNKVNSLEAKIEAIDGRFEAIDGRFEAIDGRFEAIDGRFEAIDGKFEAIDGKFEARFNSQSTQIKFIFAMLAALLALGLIDTVVPLVA